MASLGILCVYRFRDIWHHYRVKWSQAGTQSGLSKLQTWLCHLHALQLLRLDICLWMKLKVLTVSAWAPAAQAPALAFAVPFISPAAQNTMNLLFKYSSFRAQCFGTWCALCLECSPYLRDRANPIDHLRFGSEVLSKEVPCWTKKLGEGLLFYTPQCPHFPRWWRRPRYGMEIAQVTRV